MVRSSPRLYGQGSDVCIMCTLIIIMMSGRHEWCLPRHVCGWWAQPTLRLGVLLKEGQDHSRARPDTVQPPPITSPAHRQFFVVKQPNATPMPPKLSPVVITLLTLTATLFLTHILPQLLSPPSASPIIPPQSTPDMSYTNELRVALHAVQRASLLTKSVFHSHSKGTLSKLDASPVTVGDFGAQALIISALQHAFPHDSIIAEEEAKDLRENESTRKLVWDLVQKTKLEDKDAEADIGGPVKGVDSMLDLIDLGAAKGGKEGRVWVIDPIDGTKGFLRGGQYAVCLGLLVAGDVKVGVLGCPNLPVSDSEPLAENIGADASDQEGKFGVLFSAVQGAGAESRPLQRGALADGKAIHMAKVDNIADATFCESVEAGHSSQSDSANIASLLGITKPSVRMDSQAKYGSIARGAGDLYLRLPVRADYVEKIWDHAAGDLIVREAGGEVTDVEGRRLDFSHGRTLQENKGVVAAPKGVHAQVIKAVQEVLGKKKKGAL